MKIMGTGSRSLVTAPDRKEVYETLQRYILALREECDHLVLISGMAEGWDEAIAKVGLDNDITYKVVLPTKDYGSYYWGKRSQLKRNRIKRFNELVAGAFRVIYLEELYGEPTFLGRGQGMPGPNYWVEDSFYLHANFLRNQVMVNMCDMALAYNPQSAGTKDAVARLKLADKPYEVYPFIKQEELSL